MNNHTTKATKSPAPMPTEAHGKDGGGVDYILDVTADELKASLTRGPATAAIFLAGELLTPHLDAAEDWPALLSDIGEQLNEQIMRLVDASLDGARANLKMLLTGRRGSSTGPMEATE